MTDPSSGWTSLAEQRRAPPPDPGTPEVPTALVKAGGGALMLGGLLSVLSGAQLQFILHLWGAQKLAPPFMVAVGIAALLAGSGFMRARRRAVFASLALGGLLALGNVAWSIYSAVGGFFSLWVFFSTVASLLGIVLAGIAAPEALKVDAARSALLID